MVGRICSGVFKVFYKLVMRCILLTCGGVYYIMEMFHAPMRSVCLLVVCPGWVGLPRDDVEKVFAYEFL
jgi:hypothetical protein